MTQEKIPQNVRNVIRDTHKNVKYVIMASRKLDLKEKLKQLKIFMSNSLNIRQKRGSTVTFYADEENL